MSVVTQGVATATMARGPISFVTPGAARAAMARGPISFVTPGAARAAMARGPISFVTPGAARAAMARGPISMHSGSEMTRPILSEDLIHPTIRDKVATNRVCIVREVQEVIASNDVVVVGMRINPAPRKARRLLDSAGISYKYLSYGSYFRQWRLRTALKMWTGWQTFPMIFVKGVFIGGASDLEKLIGSGELKKMLADPRSSA